MKKYVALSLYCILMGACNLFEVRNPATSFTESDSVSATIDSGVTFSNTHIDTLLARDSVRPVTDNAKNKDTVALPPSQKITTGSVSPDAVVSYAETLTGMPYVYASVNPKVGFDCSGFITHVFNHFKIAVPRSSIDFTQVGRTVAVAEARRGDLILFTGTDSTEKNVGHMGLVVSNVGDSLHFIHSTSGKAMGVTTTALNGYYKKRFVRIARIFP
ncbi:MAG TPA: C40 family peptidase [Chitinophagaceae bacterium]|nr:C40 family peptidase [Chitinophagaceae bacterium]